MEAKAGGLLAVELSKMNIVVFRARCSRVPGTFVDCDRRYGSAFRRTRGGERLAREISVP